MLNYLWAAMILVGIVYGIITGNIDKVGDAATSYAKDAVDLCIVMIGIMSMWMGLMNVARESGLIEKMECMLNPLVRFLFPRIPKEHKAREFIVSNIIANILGLGWAATPAGLRAMEELAKNPIGKVKDKVATNEMCTFLVINISSLQIIPINIIAYRSQYGSENPTAIVLPAILATFTSTLVGICFCKIMCRKDGLT